MKVEIVGERDSWPGWLREKYGDCVSQISVGVTLKLKSAVLDVARMKRGHVPPRVEELARRFALPPQGLSDHKFVLGYEDEAEGEIKGSCETDPPLMEYIKEFPEDWEVVKKCLGLVRQKSRHACLPAGELIHAKGGLFDIIACDGREVYTGQGRARKGHFAPNGRATLLEQGEREVVEYTLGNGKILRCTPDHRVLTETGVWVEAQVAFEQGLELAKSDNRIRLTQVSAQQYAAKRDGVLVSWGGTATKISQWQCREGHRWGGSLTRMFSNESWCRVCSHRYRFRPSKTHISLRRSASKCLSTYRRYDASHGYKCDLSVDDVVAAKKSPCCYCGRAATGFERIDNTTGHTKANCVPACLRCNWMRGRYVSHEVMVQVGSLLRAIDP